MNDAADDESRSGSEAQTVVPGRVVHQLPPHDYGLVVRTASLTVRSRRRVSGELFGAFVEAIAFCGLGRLFGPFRGRLFGSGHWFSVQVNRVHHSYPY